MHTKFVGGFERLVCPPPMVAGLIQFTRALNSVKSSFDLYCLTILLSLEHRTHSAELALI